MGDSETFNELTLLIPIHFRHQSEEEASAMQVAHTRSTQGKADDNDSEPGTSTLAHNPKAAASQDSEWWKLLKKINEII